MKKKNKRLIWWSVGFIILFISGLFLFNLIQQTFVISQSPQLLQYNVISSDECLFSAYHSGISSLDDGCEVIMQGYPTDKYFESKFSDEVSINSGLNTFNFKTIKDDIVTDLESSATPAIGLRNPVGLGCWQKTEVRKNGVLMNTIKSWESDADPYGTEDYWKDHDFVFYDDDTTKLSGIKFKTIENAFTYFARFGNGCPWFVNKYEIFLDNNTIDYNISYKIENNNLSITTEINNKLSIEVNGTLNLKLKTSTILGNIESISKNDVNIKPGKTTINLQIASENNVDLDITPSLEIKFNGNRFLGLNYPISTSLVLRCEFSGQDTDCTPPAQPSGVPREIRNSDFIIIGSVVGDTQKIKIVNENIIYINTTTNQTIYIIQNQTITNNTIINTTTNQTFTCKELGCPTNYECKKDVCILEEDKINLNTIYLIAGIIASLVTIGSVVYLFIK